MSADLTDLLGRPYKLGGTDLATGVDCLFTSQQTLLRIFPGMAPEELPCTPDEQAAAITAAREGASRWELVGENIFSATTEGDLIVGERPNGHRFTAVLFDAETRRVITAVPDRGVLVLPTHRLPGTRQVFRRRVS